MLRILLQTLTMLPDSIDMNGHVNNKEYVRWMEEVAIEHSAKQGWPLSRYQATNPTWVIRSHYIEYIRPAFKGDELIVATWVGGMEEKGSPRKYRFVRKADGKTVVEAESRWVFCDASTGRPIEITDEIREAFPIVTSEEEIAAAIADAMNK